MKHLTLTFLLVFAFSSLSFADSVECTLSSGKESASATVDLVKGLDKYVTSDAVHDLDFHMLIECKENKKQSCVVDISFTSAILEDESGSYGFYLERAGDSRIVSTEPIENAPDKREYKFICHYKK